MRNRKQYGLGIVLSLICLGASGIAWGQTGRGTPEPDTPERRPFLMRLFGRPAKGFPLSQMAYAMTLEAQGRRRAAERAYADLVRIWPRSDQAPQAQFRRAQLLYGRGARMAAFEAFTELLERYSSHYPYEDALNRQFEIAQHMLHVRHARWFFGIGFKDAERAVPLLKAIVARGPSWAGAAEAQYLIGEAYRLAREPELAVEAYGACHSRYPQSPFAERALSARAKVLYELARHTPNDLGLNQSAYDAMTFFLRRYPENPDTPDIRTALDGLFAHRAQAAYQRARFYDAHRFDRSVSLAAYKRFIEEYPASEWTAVVQARLAELQPQKENLLP